MLIRSLDPTDAAPVRALYLAVAGAPGSGLAREPDEMTPAYVQGFLARAAGNGICLGAFDGESLVGEIHAARMGPRQFDHVLTDLTVAVHPGYQGRGIGQRLFQALFEAVRTLQPVVTRVELVARSGNHGALRLYERLGFVREGTFRGRVRLRDGTVEDDVPMARLLDAT